MKKIHITFFKLLSLFFLLIFTHCNLIANSTFSANKQSDFENSSSKNENNSIQKEINDVSLLQTNTKMQVETAYLVMCLERAHFSKLPLESLDMKEFLLNYMKDLDYLKLFLLQEEIDSYINRYSPIMVSLLKQGQLLPAFNIFNTFRTNAKERFDWICNELEGSFDLTKDDIISLDIKENTFPTSKQEADDFWRKRLKYEIVTDIISKKNSDIKKKEKFDKLTKEEKEDKKDEKIPSVKSDEEYLSLAKENVKKRYERLLKQYNQIESGEVQEIFLNTLAKMYDPHSAFLSEYQLEEFEIAIRNSLYGIGATLREKDGYCTIVELTPGSPAEKSGKIKPGDKIIAVAQGKDGEFLDTIGMKLRKSVKLIRGKEGSIVRLLVEPVNGDPSERKEVTLVRQKIEITTNLSKAQVFEMTSGDKTINIGVIEIPSFYGKDHNGEGFSTSEDVEELIEKLKTKNIKGLILDMRLNGGGFLNEAVDLAGLFIETGAVLQVKDLIGRLNTLEDENKKIVWNGPLVIMVSRMSASATEIVTGALQNHKKAIVIGDDQTHGKGTVQVVHEFKKDTKNLCKSAAKITIQKWYLPDGNSIQLKGVSSDICLPSYLDNFEIGEEHLEHPMKWDAITPLKLDIQENVSVNQNLILKLKLSSQNRQNNLEEFKFLKDKISFGKTLQNRKEVSINIDKRTAQIKEDKQTRQSFNDELKKLAKNNFNSKEILLSSAKDVPEKEKFKFEDEIEFEEETEDLPEFDIHLREALRIILDWINLNEQNKNTNKKNIDIKTNEMLTKKAS